MYLEWKTTKIHSILRDYQLNKYSKVVITQSKKFHFIAYSAN